MGCQSGGGGGLSCLRRFTVDCTADCKGSGRIKVRDCLPQGSPAMRRRCLDFLLACANPCPPNTPTLCLYTPGNSNRLRNASWLARHVFQLFRALWLKSRSAPQDPSHCCWCPTSPAKRGKRGSEMETAGKETPANSFSAVVSPKQAEWIIQGMAHNTKDRPAIAMQRNCQQIAKGRKTDCNTSLAWLLIFCLFLQDCFLK